MQCARREVRRGKLINTRSVVLVQDIVMTEIIVVRPHTEHPEITYDRRAGNGVRASYRLPYSVVVEEEYLIVISVRGHCTTALALSCCQL